MNAAGELYIGLMSGTSSDAIDAALQLIFSTPDHCVHASSRMHWHPLEGMNAPKARRE